jgi:hypothetical protein
MFEPEELQRLSNWDRLGIVVMNNNVEGKMGR